MAGFRLKIAPSRSSLPRDATGERMAAMQHHDAHSRDYANARSAVVAIAAISTVGILDRPPAICRRKFNLTHIDENQDLNNGH